MSKDIYSKLVNLAKVKLNETNQIIIDSEEVTNFIVDNNYLLRALNLNEEKTMIRTNIGINENINNISSEAKLPILKWFQALTIKAEFNIKIFTIGIESNLNNFKKKLLRCKKQNLLIVINNFNGQSEDMCTAIKDIIRDINTCLSAKKKNNVTIVIFSKTYEELKDIKFNNIIRMDRLDKNDIYKLAVNSNEFKGLQFDDFEKVYELNAGNWDGTFSTLRIIKSDNFKLDEESLDKLLDKLLKKINDKIKFEKISADKVLKLFTVFPKLFDPYEVTKLDFNITEYELEEGIQILERLVVLKKENEKSKYYSMIQLLKDNLLRRNEKTKKELFNIYYKYLVKFSPLEYQRKIDVQTNYLHDIEELKFQYLLQYEYYFINKMNENIVELKNIISKNNVLSKLDEMFTDISSFNYLDKTKSLYFKYASENKKINAFFLKKDIEYYSIAYNSYSDLKSLCDKLYEIIIEEKIFNEDPFYKVLFLIILIPQYIDKFNEEEKTNTLLKELKEIKNQKNSEEVTKNVELYSHILKRKSYLLKDTFSAIIDCKSALAFFEEAKNIDEMYMTLNTLMCLEIINDNMSAAFEYKERILQLNLCDDKKTILQYYKSEMNFILLDIFNDNLDNNAAINKYKDILNAEKNLSNTVQSILCLNICALSLENDDIATYEEYKNKAQEINKVEDIASLDDKSINNFYSYYFVWFEFGKNILQNNIDKARDIYIKLKDFIPTIYIKESKIFDKKYKSYEDIFNNTIKSGKEFSNYALNKKSNIKEARFFFRGSMLTDIHHTSIL